jgi:predicted N-acetyltransferase YhbS
MSSRTPRHTLVRLEKPGDATRIREVNEVAFEGTVEADLTDTLRGAVRYRPEFSKD